MSICVHFLKVNSIKIKLIALSVILGEIQSCFSLEISTKMRLYSVIMELFSEKTRAVIIQVLFCRYFASKIIPKQSLLASWNLSDPQENSDEKQDGDYHSRPLSSFIWPGNETFV